MSNELDRQRPLERLVGRLYELATELYEKTPQVSDELRDMAGVVEKVDKAISLVLLVVDDMGVMRQDLCEGSIKALDRKLMDMRSAVSAAESLEQKLSLMKEQREMERIRRERRERLFDLMDDGAIYAHDPLPRDELVELVEPLRAISQPPNTTIELQCAPIRKTNNSTPASAGKGS